MKCTLCGCKGNSSHQPRTIVFSLFLPLPSSSFFFLCGFIFSISISLSLYLLCGPSVNFRSQRREEEREIAFVLPIALVSLPFSPSDLQMSTAGDAHTMAPSYAAMKWAGALCSRSSLKEPSDTIFSPFLSPFSLFSSSLPLFCLWL